MDAYWRNGANAFEQFGSEDEFQFKNVWKDRIITGSPETCVAGFKHWSQNNRQPLFSASSPPCPFRRSAPWRNHGSFRTIWKRRDPVLRRLMAFTRDRCPGVADEEVEVCARICL